MNNKRGRRQIFTALRYSAIALALLAGTGCVTKYYRITDPGSGRVYYGEGSPTGFVDSGSGYIHQVDGGVTVFQDLVTGDFISLTNYERREITRDQVPAPATRPHE